MKCPACGHAQHDPTGPITSRGCGHRSTDSRYCYCLRVNDVSGNVMPNPPRYESAEERAARRRARATPPVTLPAVDLADIERRYTLDYPTARAAAQEMIAEWDYGADPHGWCHRRPVLMALLRELDRRQEMIAEWLPPEAHQNTHPKS